MKVLVLIAAFSCLQIPAAQSAGVEAVKVGVALRFAPEVNSFAPALYEGIEMAKQVFEKEHPGLAIELIKYPHQNGHASVEDAAKKIIKDKVMFVMGGEMSDDAFTLAENFHNHSVLLMTPTASNPLLTAGNPLVFRACFSDDQVASAMAKYVATLSQYHSIGIVHNTSNAYSDYLTNAFSDALANYVQENKIALTEFRYASETPDFKGAVEQFKKAKVDLVIAFTLQAQLKSFYQAASRADLQPTYIGSDGWGTTDSLQKWLGDDFKGIRNSYWLEESKDPAVISFKTAFTKKDGKEPDAWNAVSYDAALNLFESIAKTKNHNDAVEVGELLHSGTFRHGVTAREQKFNSKNSISKPFYLYEIKKNSVKFVKEIK